MKYLTNDQTLCFAHSTYNIFIIWVHNGKYYTVETHILDYPTCNMIIWESKQEMINNIVWDGWMIECITDEALKKEVEFKELASAEEYKKRQDQFYYELELRKKN